jgi:Mg2+ and Co2+ transporter CorA
MITATVLRYRDGQPVGDPGQAIGGPGPAGATGDGADGDGTHPKKVSFTWYDLGDGSVPEVPAEFGLPEAAVTWLHADGGRGGLHVEGDLLLLAIRICLWDEHDGEAAIRAIRLVAGPGLVVTAGLDRELLAFVRKAVEADRDLLQSGGPSAVLFAVVDKAVRGLGPAMRGLSEAMEELEQAVFLGEGTNPAQRIYRLSRQLLELRKAVTPLAGALDRLLDEEQEQISGLLRRRLRKCAATCATPPRPWTPSATCRPTSSRPTSPRSRCARTTTCARSRPGPR